MKQALIIGSTVADVTVRLPHLPVTGEDVIVESQSMSLGGCAYNVSEILRQSGVPYTLFSPVGTGIYGNYVREHLKRKQIPILIPAPAADNGCCYCLWKNQVSGPLRPFTARNTVLKGSGSAWQNPCPWDLSMCAGWNWRRIQGASYWITWKSTRNTLYTLRRVPESASSPKAV